MNSRRLTRASHLQWRDQTIRWSRTAPWGLLHCGCDVRVGVKGCPPHPALAGPNPRPQYPRFQACKWRSCRITLRASCRRERMQQGVWSDFYLFDHLVGAGEQRGRQGEAEYLGGRSGQAAAGSRRRRAGSSHIPV